MSKPRPFSIPLTAVVAGIINALINGGLGWLVLPAGKVLPLWGVPGLGADTLAMAFGISFGTGIAVTPQIRAQLRSGKLLAAPISPRWRAEFERWPSSIWRRSINLGLVSVPLFAPLPLLALWAFGVQGAAQLEFASYKALFGFVQGAIVTPVIAMGAMVPGGQGAAVER